MFLYVQAFFTVIDGHGGRAAADYVAENLGKNIVRAIRSVEEEEAADPSDLEQAIRCGYLVTDEEFLSKVHHRKWYPEMSHLKFPKVRKVTLPLITSSIFLSCSFLMRSNKM